MLKMILSSQLELSVLTLLAILLYSYRYVIGQAPLYIMVGIYYIFALFSDIPHVGGANAHLYDFIGNGILWLPFLLLLLIIYELEGIRAAQRFFLGLIFATFCFFCMLMITYGLFSADAPVFIRDFVALYADHLNSRGQMGICVNALRHLSIIIMAPILYQTCVINRIRKGVAIMIVMVIYLTLNEAMSALYTATFSGVKAYEPLPIAGWLLRLSSAFFLSLIGDIFLNINADLALRHPARRSVFGFLTEFTSFLPSAEKMNRSLSEWAERYELVVENSSEIILLLGQDGRILNMNRAAVEYLGEALKQNDFSLDKVVTNADGSPWFWQKTLPPMDIHDENGATLKNAFRCRNLFLRVPGRKRVDLDINVSQTTYNNTWIAILIGHDMTAQREEARQHAAHAEVMMHSQRLESIGVLAGGVAHDFNNLMHSVEASVDALKMKYRPAGEAAHLLNIVDESCRRATTLTSQLLGFAHKGKFHAEEHELQVVLEHSMQLFSPSAKGITCKLLCAPEPMRINCDEVQLSQVVLNMLINSRDAIAERQQKTPATEEYRPRITIRAEIANDEMKEWAARPVKNLRSADFVCIRIRDNGCGMDEATKTKIFDPFFTTKPIGKGTGMGMAMAFGCIANHKGFLQVTSAPMKGCDIAIFLPRITGG